MAKIPEPATKSYFFEKGFFDVGRTIIGAWSRNYNSISGYVDRIREQKEAPFLKKIVVFILNFLAIASVLVCGSVITAVMTLLNMVFLILIMLLIFIGFSTIWLIDRCYLVKNKIFTACNDCKTKSLIPIYLCPNCHSKHSRLYPSVYGILKRKCCCGTKIPTTFFNGRKDLQAICASCGKTLAEKESRPICIPVVGGSSVGKTAFITAFTMEFIGKVAPSRGVEVSFYDKEKYQIYRDICEDYHAGTVRTTKKTEELSETSSISLSFFAKHPLLVPDRLIHIYDIAGEVFANNWENEVQKQYQYCHGIVLMIDPYAIPSVWHQFGRFLSENEKNAVGKNDVYEIINSFSKKIKEITGLSDKNMSKTPLAVVLSKTDSGHLNQILGDEVVNTLVRENPDKFTDFNEAQDYICRKFLRENEMDGFLNSISLQFKKNRFFSCSAIGHGVGDGCYEPRGVLSPIHWICSLSDSKIAQVWANTIK